MRATGAKPARSRPPELVHLELVRRIPTISITRQCLRKSHGSVGFENALLEVTDKKEIQSRPNTTKFLRSRNTFPPRSENIGRKRYQSFALEDCADYESVQRLRIYGKLDDLRRYTDEGIWVDIPKTRDAH
jgi:hypothetical protein